MDREIALARLVSRIAARLRISISHARVVAELHYTARPAR